MKFPFLLTVKNYVNDRYLCYDGVLRILAIFYCTKDLMIFEFELKLFVERSEVKSLMICHYLEEYFSTLEDVDINRSA